jgi:hypothetical protein
METSYAIAVVPFEFVEFVVLELAAVGALTALGLAPLV